MANEGKFRRLQCEQAVVGVVNDAIAEGDIQAGTKWYKHTFTGNATTYDSETIDFLGNTIIISTIETKITDKTIFENVLKNGFISDQGNIEGMGGSALILYSSYNGFMVFKSGSTPAVYAPLMSIANANDVVAPL